MSSYAPQYMNGPTQRHSERWQPVAQAQQPELHGSSNGISEKVGGFFGADRRDQLPMYKDKPARGGRGFGYLTSDRRHPWYRQKRTAALILSLFAAISWWFGILSPLSYFSSSTIPGIIPGRKSISAGWEQRAERVRDAFKVSFAGYEKHAWGYDEFHPVSKGRRQMTPNGMGWIIVDALDTMMLMNLTSELKHARQWIHDSLSYDQDHDVNTFETTIRMLGGLLSAHYLSTEFEGIYAPVDDGYSDDMYIEKATDLADRLLGAYETKSGVPLASVNLHTMQGLESHADAGASSTAEATSLQLEMKYLAKLTGEDNYWDKAERVMKVVDDNNPEDGLVPIFMYADKGTFRGENIRLGSRGDSYYEYLIKQYLQTSEQEPVYQAMWNESLAGMKKHLISYSYPSNFTVIAERPNGLAKAISGKMDHLVCFMPGTIALATTKGLPLAEARAQPNWGPRQDEDMRLAEELMNTCWGMYMATPARLAGEITHFHMHSPPFLYDDFNDHPEKRPHSPLNFDKISPGHDFAGRDDFIIKGGDSHNLQRPETVESLFYMWRITGEERYRNWGWEMFQSFMKWTDVGDGSGYSSLSSVLKTPPPMRDNMESFWLAETLKYFYLLFSSNDILPLTDVVFNTEAHAFPRFQLGKLFTTGWQRLPRDKDGKIIPEADKEPEAAAIVAPPVVMAVNDAAKQDQVTTTTAENVPTEPTPPAAQAPLDAVSGENKAAGS